MRSPGENGSYKYLSCDIMFHFLRYWVSRVEVGSRGVQVHNSGPGMLCGFHGERIAGPGMEGSEMFSAIDSFLSSKFSHGKIDPRPVLLD